MLQIHRHGSIHEIQLARPPVNALTPELLSALRTAVESAPKEGARGIILSGGPESTTEENSPRAPQEVFDAGVPILGICYGMQTMAMQLGGLVEGGHHREFGYAEVEVTAECALLDGLKDHAGSPPRLDVWMSHGDRVTRIPEGFEVTARTASVPNRQELSSTRNMSTSAPTSSGSTCWAYRGTPDFARSGPSRS